jgi:uncharacterized membrane protein YhaH (DUF805 family)
MPFTFSHPGAVLPLNYIKKRWISLSGLIAGSMVPDFEYFIRMRDKCIYSHTWIGLFWFDLPLGLLLIFTYHNIVRSSLIEHLPLGLKRRLWRYKYVRWNNIFKSNWWAVLISILIGASSHLLWDRLTHKTNHVVNQISAIRAHNYSDLPFRPYYLLWELSSLIGGAIVLYSLWQLPVDKTVKASSDAQNYWLKVLIITIIIIAIKCVSHFTRFSIFDLAIIVMSAFLIAIILASLINENKVATEVDKSP